MNAPSQGLWTSRWLVAAAAALAALVLLTGVGLALHEREEVLKVEVQRQTVLARVLEEHATRSIDSALLALRSVAELMTAQTDPEITQAALQQTLASLPYLRGAALLDTNGQMLATTEPEERDLVVDLRHLGRLPAPGQEAVGGFVPGRSLASLRGAPAGVPSGVGFVPLMRMDRLRSGRLVLLVALLNPDALSTFQQLTLDDEHAAAALVDMHGSVLASTTTSDWAPGRRLPAGLQALQALRNGAEHGRWDGPGLRSGRQLGAFRGLRGRPLAVLLEVDADALHAHWRSDAQWIAVMAVAVATMVVVMAVLAAHYLRARERARRELDGVQRQVMAREQELSAIFGSVQDLLFRTDGQGRLTFINDRYATLSGRSTQTAIGQPLARLFDDDARLQALFGLPPPAAEDAAAPAPRQARATWSEASGRQLHFDITLVPLRARDGTLSGWAGSAVDVSRLLDVQAELRAQLGFAQSLLANSPLPTSVLDRQGRYVDVNRAWEEFTGRRRHEVLGRSAASYLPPDEAAVHDARDRELLARGGEVRYEARWRAPDGSTRDLYINKSTFADSRGRSAGIVVALMDISEFREAERATRQARDAAVAASQAKSEFIANMSHELRTPLQSILGFSELGRMRSGEHPRLAGMFDDVHRAGQRMLALVNDLLDLAKIENGADRLEPERADLRPLVVEVAAELQPQCAARQLQIALAQSDAPLVALIDGPRLQEVIRNVLANALRFSPQGGTVDVHSDIDEQGQVCLSVADRGPGIPDAELESIFEAFVQSSATKDGSGGTGLGLAISRRIVAAHGGHLSASNRPGGGSVFTLTLPPASFGDTSPATL